MTNLFSVFDPSTGSGCFSLNWLSSLVGFMIIPYFYWMVPSRHNFLFTKIANILHGEFKVLLGPNMRPGLTLLFISLFFYVVFNNFLGLFPYIFTSTSHLSFTLSLSLPLWLSFMIYGWFNNTQHMFAHLVPQGTPSVLMPFMVCIETISNVIRPGTLAVRLSANMIAGHLLMTLMGNTGPSMATFMVGLLIIGQVCLLVLESAVALIQGYVFAVLSTLYSSEV
uniref:ATP synthase subunit a n=1 Tax=Takobia yixiani TaxID=743459 RepID=X1W3E3_9INSE|nr:ATP synthase F0 subunit 6 [Takobia yixiani]